MATAGRHHILGQVWHVTHRETEEQRAVSVCLLEKIARYSAGFAPEKWL